MNSHLLNKNIHAAEDKKHTATSVRKEKKKEEVVVLGDTANGYCSPRHSTFQKQPGF